jgi:urease alpha subunit
MAFASHLGPWLLGTVKNTTGTTAGTIRNMGATEVTQTVTLDFNSINNSLTGTAFVLPAGSMITYFKYFTTSTFADSTPTAIATTVKLTIGATDVTAATTVTGPANPANMTGATASNAVTSLFANVGATDAIVTYTATKAAGTYASGSVTLQCTYTVRNSDGAANPSQV